VETNIFAGLIFSYGDKTPKFVFGRLFGVIWIMTGLVIIAIFTATATSSINISVDGWAVVRGKKVLRGCLHNFPKYRSPISIYEGFTLFFGLLVCSLCFVLFCFVFFF